MENDGKYLEYLVQLIEKSISPDSIVEHDVELPILNSPQGATAQCDIVIRTGKKPRETISIVEVQDRTSKVKPNDFRGWQLKLQQVGAQHLICVSRKEFPSSIKEQASLSGNTIRLITLKELTAEQIPLNFFQHRFNCNNFDITAVHYFKIRTSKLSDSKKNKLPTGKLDLNQMIYSIDKSHLKSIYLLCLEYLRPKENQKEGRDKLKFDARNIPLYCFVEDRYIKVGMEIEFEWILKTIEVQASTISYEQDGHGSLAWVLEAEMNSSSGPAFIKIPVVYNEDSSSYQIRNMFVNLPVNSKISIKIEKKEG